VLVVSRIEAKSLGERAGFAAGDEIHALNGEPIRDLIDFQVHASDEVLHFEVSRGGELFEVEVGRLPEESLGVAFEETPLRRCDNRCVFCFIHQMPKGLRRSLYIEDDDYRLSFLHGSYVTLTNVADEDLDRIIAQGLSPQYLSVHATDPQLRQRLLGRRRPTPDILARISRLAEHGIEMHAQVVLCPGWNDGTHLERTVRELCDFYPAVRSVALVPVGLTRFRGRLTQLQPVTQALAQEYVDQAEHWGSECKRAVGGRFVYAADELFLLTSAYPPPRSYYEAFPQIENGIGMVRSFLDTWEQEKTRLPRRLDRPAHLGLVTGQLARFFLEPIAAELNRVPGLRVEVLDVPNEFFGRGITVSGLLAGQDILRRIQDGPWDLVMLPPNCVNGEGLTLDDMTVPALAESAQVPVSVGQYDLAGSLQAFLAESAVRLQGSGRQLSEQGYYVGRR
jgi:putative radical SAM enzyme (TIGR03279 family)